MESKTIRVKRTIMAVQDVSAVDRFDAPRGELTVYVLGMPDAQELDIIITPVASPEERLREARIAGLRVQLAVDFVPSVVEDMAQEYLAIIERVDAEFAKEKP